MFDKAIIDTDSFMDLPSESKALYFLLGMEADDEGFVSPRRVMKLHNLVVKGLVNGLSHTSGDERLEDINFWRKRCNLFNEFSKCVLDIVTDQNPKYAEKNLKEVAKEGYK